MIKGRTIISILTFNYDGNLLEHIQGELDMWIILPLIHMLFTSVEHNRQRPILNSTKADEHDMCGVRILQQDAQNAFWKNHICFPVVFFAQPFVNNAELHEGG